MVICCKGIKTKTNKIINYQHLRSTNMQTWFILSLMIIFIVQAGNAIDCFQCNSSSNMECSDNLMNLNGGILEAVSCDHVYNAKYCIKHTGRITTKRYCSSLDLGTYCNYVQQPGDKLEYRSCIYTCGTDGCNGTSNLKISKISIISGLIIFKHIGFQ